MCDLRSYNILVNCNQRERNDNAHPNFSVPELADYEQHNFYGPDRIQYSQHNFPGSRFRSEVCDNAERERSRVKTLRSAFLELQRTLPAVPPDTKLSKLDVLVLATTYIAHLMRTLSDQEGNQVFAANGILHPVKKWPMRSRLYAGILSSTMYTRRYTRPTRDPHNDTASESRS